ncbi:carbohydrate ABC transporter permease [Infirmifilum lucidum]|uniref:Carbohydrate ABC transporter permease n=1 Tax=Infirmifilum lucidum TaxID=2776706 RepID=A0A7L9FIW0_9CREN|nr:carbohydrate ABC transporter permease [Infirmifilum lucidum]QOJ78854.1 carbohydrate ABC transporter permease [Infirmifilum lucidum]
MRIRVESIGLYLGIALVLLWTLTPIYWIANVSLRAGLEVYEAFSPKITFENYVKLFQEGFERYLVNTVYLAFLSTAISLALAVPASYAISRLALNEYFRRGFLAWTLFARTIPPIVLILPIYVMFASMKLLDNLNAVAMAYQIYTLPFALWTLIGFFRAVPKEVEEAALVDGAGPLTILVRVMLPIVAPGLVATAIFCLLMTWNEFLYAVILLQSLKNYTVPLVIASYISEWGVKWGEMAAAGIISSLPMLLFTGYVQKYLVLGFMKK